MEQLAAKMSAKKLQRLQKVCPHPANVSQRLILIQRQGRSKKING